MIKLCKARPRYEKHSSRFIRMNLLFTKLVCLHVHEMTKLPNGNRGFFVLICLLGALRCSGRFSFLKNA